ncbi:diacylglycerol kinase [Pseudohyphozyma bogoriensis]|nr:diacylglycerol kinase [Pseudohyphozyma bogoriensis]
MAPTLRSRANKGAESPPSTATANGVKHAVEAAASSVPLARDPSLDRVDRGRVRSGLEIPRKLLHSSISIGVTFLWLNHPNVPLIIRTVAIFLAFVVACDVARFRSMAFEVQYEKYLGYFMRESERDRVNGVIFYLVGVLVCLTFYPRDIACLSIMILSICDTSASVFGRLFGRFTPKLPFSGTLFGAKKSLAGTLACIATGTLTAYVFWSQLAIPGDEGDLSWLPGRMASEWKGSRTGRPTWIPGLPTPESTLGVRELAVINGVVAGVAEAIDLWGLDDNLTLPVLFGFGCWAVMWVIG